jgi:hypothetical protein
VRIDMLRYDEFALAFRGFLFNGPGGPENGFGCYYCLDVSGLRIPNNQGHVVSSNIFRA